jgi:anti-sigma factor RsiW
MIAAIPDEWIMAYADGELDADLETRLAEAVRDDDAIRRKYEIFRMTRAPLAAVFEGVLDEPVPDRLKAAVTGSKPRWRS